MKNYAFIGMPGSGKGTMAKKMTEEFGFIHLSMGDLIRKEQEQGTKIGELASRMVDNGQFLPDSIVIKMFQQFIGENPTDVGYIFDGYPRNESQAKHFNAFLLKSKLPFNGAVYLELDKPEAFKRLLMRAKTENRKDDTPEVIKSRIELYDAKTKPILKFFDDRGKLIKVDAGGSIEQQFEKLKGKLGL